MFDTLNPLCNKAETVDLSSLLSSFISPTVSVVAVYHMDIPRQRIQMDPYAPAPIILLKYFATTTFTMHSLHHVLEKKRARERSLVEPSYGLEAEIEASRTSLGQSSHPMSTATTPADHYDRELYRLWGPMGPRDRCLRWSTGGRAAGRLGSGENDVSRRDAKALLIASRI